MRDSARLAAFLGAIALVGGGFALLGGAIDPVHDETTAGAHGHDAGGAEDGDADAHGAAARGAPGLAVAEGGYRLELLGSPDAAGQQGRLRFRILGPDGTAERDLEPEQGGVPLHLIVVRRDLTGFQHLHPRMAADGSWSVGLGLPRAGSYRAFADFTVDGAAITLGTDLIAAGDLRPRALPEPTTLARAGGYVVRMDRAALRAGQDADLTFQVSLADGRAADVEPYLGADGHLVALREGDLAYLHVHPEDSAGEAGRIGFRAAFPSVGRYRLFLQFQRAGRVELAPFTVEVAR